jgi:hypothetical protein
VFYNFDTVIIPIRAMQQDFRIVLLCFSKLSDDIIPLPKHVGADKCHELYFILLRTCVGWCINCKNLHGMNNIKYEGKVLLKVLVVSEKRQN